MRIFWLLMVLLTVVIILVTGAFLGYSLYHDIYDYVCDELDKCKYFGE